MQRLRKISYNQSQSIQIPPSVMDTSKEQTEHKMFSFRKMKSLQSFPIFKNQEIFTSHTQINQIPSVTLTVEQMQKDPIQLIMRLQRQFIKFGAVKICTPKGWNPPFCARYSEKLISTRTQIIENLKQGKGFEQNIGKHNISSFAQFAQNYQKGYKPRTQKHRLSSEQETERQYWSIVNSSQTSNNQSKPKNKTIIEYAADLPTQEYGSGFPRFQTSRSKDENFNYATNLFNLNNLYKSQKSLLRFSQLTNQQISGITTPWLYMGMLFSTFCWHVEDLWLNSINYSHKGATKTWYIIPQEFKQAFDDFVLKKTNNKRQLLNSLTFIIDPLQLRNNGIWVYKAYQRPGQFILTLFNAYHCGFSQGYNVGQAVNLATIDSLNIMVKALDSISIRPKSFKPPAICYQWLVVSNLGNNKFDHLSLLQIKEKYNKIVKGQQQILKAVVQKHSIVRVQLFNNNLKYDKLVCCLCKFYQYLSILKCLNCERKYCLYHVSKCCGKGFVFLTREGDQNRSQTIQFVWNHVK